MAPSGCQHSPANTQDVLREIGCRVTTGEIGVGKIRVKLGIATVYFAFLGLPTGNAVNLLPIMPSIVLMKTSSPQGRPAFVF